MPANRIVPSSCKLTAKQILIVALGTCQRLWGRIPLAAFFPLPERGLALQVGKLQITQLERRGFHAFWMQVSQTCSSLNMWVWKTVTHSSHIIRLTKNNEWICLVFYQNLRTRSLFRHRLTRSRFPRGEKICSSLHLNLCNLCSEVPLSTTALSILAFQHLLHFQRVPKNKNVI